ncbi:MAG: NUDIX hydrolase [bacterium]|nr:NUDIX hydrolase [bacterium]
MNMKPMPIIRKSKDGRPMHDSVGAIIKDGQGRYFLMDRKYEPYGFAGMAGHVDEGEQPLEALMREGREELHTDLRDVVLLREEEVPWNFCWKAPVHYWRLYQATVDPALVNVDSHEARRSGWFTKEEIWAATYVREGVEYPLILEDVWRHWFELEGIVD